MSRRLLPHAPRARLSLAVALCCLVALVAAVASVNTISLRPLAVTPRHLDIAAAGARVVVDNPRPLVGDRLATFGDYQTLQKRAVLLGSLIVSEPVRAYIARRLGIAPGRLVGRAHVTADVEAALTEPDSERRAAMIAEADVPYRLAVYPDFALPAFSVYAQAPTVAGAKRLADAAVPALREYLAALGSASPLRRGQQQLTLEQPGPARGAVVNRGATPEIFVVTFLLVFALALIAVAVAAKVRREWVAARAADAAPAAPAAWERTGRPLTASVGDWPRTTRVLPWMLAAMMAVVWLVPFNVIELSYSLPVDLKFDRLVLPFIITMWILAMAAGGRGAPRVRMTWIHVALLGVAVAALLSLAIGARELNQALELDTSVKKLTLLASYGGLFLVVASSVRRTEVSAFLTYTLVLAVICAIGTIWEYRFHYNVFYSLSDKLLPGIFTVGQAESGAVDAIGRRVVRGPGEVPLEAVAMLTMGLPIAVCGLISHRPTRTRVLYGLATALILAAVAATERKSALIAPASVFLTIGYFRRGELIRLAPTGVAISAAVLLLTPGAAQAVVGQLAGSKLQSVTTVSDRTSDYDAVRPDVWSHIAFGRGYGSYEHTTYRTLDMELLHQLVEVGVVGLLAFLLLIGTVVAVARRPIRGRRSDESMVALTAACAAVTLLVVSTLFDALSFPHCAYIMLFSAGLLAVVVARDRDRDGGGAWSS